MPNVSIAAAGTASTENFDSLANTGAAFTNVLPMPGWALLETGAGPRDNEQYAVDTGVSNTGDTYSYGSTGSTDRALGSLLSSSLVSTFGVFFSNDTGSTITSLTISVDTEQWRVGFANRTDPDRLDFSYNVNTIGNDLAAGTWTDFNALDATGLVSSATLGAIDGNLAANRTTLTATITGLNIASGQSFGLRWADFNALSTDDGIAIDNFSLTAATGAPTPAATGDFAVGAAMASVAEGDAGRTDVSFTVTRSGGSTGAVALTYTLSGITANDLASGALTGTVAFADGDAATQTITVAVAGDRTIETDEALTVTLSGNPAGTTIATPAASTTILNDDIAGTVTVADVTVAEGGGTATLVLTRSGGEGDIAVGYATADGTATAGTDYTATSGTATFTGGATSVNVTVPILQDVLVEGNESFAVNLTAGTGAPTLTRSSATVTITDDDTLPTLTINDPVVSEGAAGTVTLTYTVTSSVPAPAGGISFDIATADGTATAGSDYIARTETGATIAAGSNTYSFAVTVNGDTTFESNETVLVNITNPVGAAVADAQGSGTIANDDIPAVARLIDENFATFTAAGFAPTPGAGQLDSDIWRVAGLSDNPNPAYGFTGPAAATPTALTGDFGRGTIAANDPTSAGVYSPAANGALIIQPTSAELDTNGFIEARLQNNSGAIVSDVAVGFDWAYRNNAARGEVVTFAYSTDGVNFTAVPAAAFTTPTDAGSPVPTTFSYQPETATIAGLNLGIDSYLYLRWTHVQSTGALNRDEVGIDNLVVDGTTASTVTIGSASVTEGQNGQTQLSFEITRTDVNSAFSINYATADGSATVANNDYQATSGTLTFAAGGPATQVITVAVNGDTVAELDETLNLSLSGLVNTTGTTGIGRATGVGTIVNDDGAPIVVSVGDVTVTEGNAGTSVATFTVTRTGSADAFALNYATADGTATAGSDYVATSGTLNFAANQATATVAVTINGDTLSESAENFVLNLTGTAPGTVLTRASGTATIANDDVTRIHDIQGSAYFSPLLAAAGVGTFNTASSFTVTVQAVVTAVDNVGITRQGFYISDARDNWDTNPSTSEGIFVMTHDDANAGTTLATSLAAGVAVGDVVTVTASIMEYQSFTSLPRTVLTNITAFTRDGHTQVLPTLLLDASRPIPNAILTEVTPDLYDSVDNPGDTFDVTTRSLSYFESIEGMLVTVPDMRIADGVVSTSGGRPYLQAYSALHANPEQINSRGGYTIAGDPPYGPPNTTSPLDDTVRDGRHLSDGDTNPDTIEVDFTDFAVAPPANLAALASAGDRLGDVTGVIDFDFTDRKLFVTAPVTLTDTTQTRETTALTAGNHALTVATFNVENLDPTDPASKFNGLATAVAQNLKLPDILMIEEIQDSNGAATGGVIFNGVSYGETDATLTWETLIAAINNTPEAIAAGAHYQWVDQEPVNNGEGGEPNGNIRVGFLYNTARVQLGDLAADATIAERRQFTDRVGDGVRDAGDRIAYSDDMIASEINAADWAGTRKSLLGQFTFQGQQVFLLANHFPSKGGSGEFYQLNQNIDAGAPENAGFAKRSADAQDVWTMLNAISTGTPGANVLAGGDFNDFYFYRPLQVATGYETADGAARVGGTRYDNLILTLPEAERYTYNYDGRSQAIDHILASSSLSSIAQYDVVHINTLLGSATAALSDHDPSVARFDFALTTPPVTTPVTPPATTPSVPAAPVAVGNTTFVAGSYTMPAESTATVLSTKDNAGTEPINLVGNANSQAIIGNYGGNILDGGGGNDTLIGLRGDDTYVVTAGTTVIENNGEGADAVLVATGTTTVSYTLLPDASVEFLAAQNPASTTAVNLTGSLSSQMMIGNAGANILNGFGGSDTLIGLGGDDTFLVRGPGDVVIEANGGGFDTVFTTVSYNLGVNEIEVLSTVTNSDTTNIDLIGNFATQTIVGNYGSNVLNGGSGGLDTLIGLFGNDVYAIGDSRTVIVENGGQGTDTVVVSVDYSLAAGVSIEVLAAQDRAGTGALSLRGNEVAQTIAGNEGANYIDGGLGNDVLIGGGGGDRFAFTSALGANNVDAIADFQAGTDKIALLQSIFGMSSVTAANFTTGTAAATADQRIVYNAGTGQLFYDADGIGSGAATLFAMVSPGTALTASSFEVLVPAIG